MDRRDPATVRIGFQGIVLEFRLDSDQPYALVETETYADWIDSIADLKTNARITKDVGKMRRGLFGDWKEADGVFEMRLNYGPGHRIYYARYGRSVIILLGGGDKRSQDADLRAARVLWKELQNEVTEIR